MERVKLIEKSLDEQCQKFWQAKESGANDVALCRMLNSIHTEIRKLMDVSDLEPQLLDTKTIKNIEWFTFSEVISNFFGQDLYVKIIKMNFETIKQKYLEKKGE